MAESLNRQDAGAQNNTGVDGSQRRAALSGRQSSVCDLKNPCRSPLRNVSTLIFRLFRELIECDSAPAKHAAAPPMPARRTCMKSSSLVVAANLSANVVGKAIKPETPCRRVSCARRCRGAIRKGRASTTIRLTAARTNGSRRVSRYFVAKRTRQFPKQRRVGRDSSRVGGGYFAPASEFQTPPRSKARQQIKD